MAGSYKNDVFTVTTADELNAAIANIDAIGKAGNNNGLTAGAYTIKSASDITLGDAPRPRLTPSRMRTAPPVTRSRSPPTANRRRPPWPDRPSSMR